MKPLSLTLCCLCHHLVVAGLALAALSGVVIMVLLLTDTRH